MSNRLERVEGGYRHWCPGCSRSHILPDRWEFNGDMDNPSFTPSFRHSWGNGKVCHYHLTNGELRFYTDSTHSMGGVVAKLEPPPLERDE